MASKITREGFLDALNQATSVKSLCEILQRTKPSVYSYAYKFKVPLKKRWTGKIRSDGYIGYTLKENHRRIAEEVLGRKLKRGECVHHIDGNKLNNENSNLLICTTSYHLALHARMSLLYQQEHFLKKVK